MSTSWRDKQRPDLVNFIATFLATNLYRLNFLSLSPVRTPIQRCHWLCRAVCVTVCTDGFDWVGLGSRISSSTMAAYRLLSSSTRTGFLKGKLRSSAGDTLVSSLCCLLLCTDDCIRGDGDGDVVLGMLLLQGEYTEEAVQVSLRRCRCPLTRAE
jgi:hypothetical protein